MILKALVSCMSLTSVYRGLARCSQSSLSFYIGLYCARTVIRFRASDSLYSYITQSIILPILMPAERTTSIIAMNSQTLLILLFCFFARGKAQSCDIYNGDKTGYASTTVS